MKLLWILTSFTLVNVLVAQLDDYGIEVFKTNECLKLVKNEYGIEGIKTYGHFEFTKNRLLDIITKMVSSNGTMRVYTSKELAIMMVLPENVNEYGERFFQCELDMQLEINCCTKIAAPDINETKDVTLSELIDERRNMITEGVLTLINRVLGGDIGSFEELLDRCRLIGLLRSLLEPNGIVIQSTIRNGTCCLERYLGNGTTRYKPDQSDFKEVNEDGNLVMYLSEQVLFWQQEISKKHTS